MDLPRKLFDRDGGLLARPRRRLKEMPERDASGLALPYAYVRGQREAVDFLLEQGRRGAAGCVKGSVIVEVRRLEPQDGDLGVTAIRVLKAPDGYPVPSAAYLSQFLSRSENVLIVALDADMPVGYLVAYLLDRVDRDQQMMFFYEIGVAESHRRQGIGKRMIAELKAICRSTNVLKMWVPTGRSNLAATRLYASTGALPLPAGDEVTYAYPREIFMGDAGDQRA